MDMPDDDGWYRIGAHSLHFEPPDVVILRPEGDLSLAETKRILATLVALPRPDHGFLVISNLTKLGRQGGQVTKELGTIPKNVISVLGIVGAAFHHRVVTETLLRVARRLNYAIVKTRIEFFPTEAAALAFWSELRRKSASSPLSAAKQGRGG